MTFTEIVNDVLTRLNLTSTEAATRVGMRVNDRYRRITSSIGLITSRRLLLDEVINPATTPSLPDYTILGMEKVLRVSRTDNSNRILILEELTWDDVTAIAPISRLPTSWAMKTMASQSVTITLDAFPTTSFTLHIVGYDISDVLSGSVEPNLPQDFHDILVEGALSDELRKMEKPALASIAEANYNNRLSDLRMFIAKSSYLDIVQGKNKPEQQWYRPWFSRSSVWN